jgi:hypothetical protein
MPTTIDITAIKMLHYNSIRCWKKTTITLIEHDFLGLVEENHAFNYRLWQAEDRARRNDRGYQFVCQAKRDIDNYNQQRNNRMEMMDAWLFNYLRPADPSQCSVNSEAPGMMIDRLSILSLKAYYMDIQTMRQDVASAHRQSCQQKLAVILIQQQQLYTCLKQLIEEVRQKTRTFRIYQQFKMYNDKTLNPELYDNLQHAK